MVQGLIFPTDPDCPSVAEFRSVLFEDPMSEYAPLDDVTRDFDRQHLPSCERCQVFAIANAEVEL